MVTTEHSDAESRPPDLARDVLRLQALTAELERIQAQAAAFGDETAHVKRGHFTADEDRALSAMVFRYVGCREALWTLVDSHDPDRVHWNDPVDRARGAVIAINAGVRLAAASSGFVATAMKDPLLKAKLNEPVHAMGVPGGTYTTVFKSLTNTENIERLYAAWELFSRDLVDPKSALHALKAAEPLYAERILDTQRAYPDANATIQRVLEDSSLWLPDVRNRLRHSSIAALAERLQGGWESRLYAARGILFTNVSRLKDPTAQALRFSAHQLAAVRAALRPGDIVLTYTAGYMSNLFLPGTFKHGITYVGDLAAREAAGLGTEAWAAIAPARRVRMLAARTTVKLPSGEQADVIEAVAEGVTFNSLEHLMQTHVNRMLVLRPRVSTAECRQYLERVFALLDAPYDFHFDFNSAEHQCCTEVIYRGLQGLGDLSFTLTPRAGQPTLSADDIVNQHLAQEGDGFFDVVLLAASVPERQSHAQILLGAAADKELRRLMPQ